MKTVGILALQGDFEAHRKAIERTGANAIEVRTKEELAQVDGLIVPGGESTTMLKLLDYEGMTDAVRKFGRSKSIYGTCAGAILLANEVSFPAGASGALGARPAQASLNLMDIGVERNAYGRQIDSRIAKVAMSDGPEMEAVFIRAPIIRRVGAGGKVLARYAGDPVWVEQGRHMVTTFHPELTEDGRVHRRFVEKL